MEVNAPHANDENNREITTQQVITNQPSAGQFVIMSETRQGDVQYIGNPANMLLQQGAIFPPQFSPSTTTSNMVHPGSSWTGANFIGIQDLQPISTFNYIRDIDCCVHRTIIKGPDGKTLYRTGKF